MSYLEDMKSLVLRRRKFIAGAAALTAAGSVAWLRQAGPLLLPEVFPEKWWNVPDLRPGKSPVAILRAASYEQDLVTVIREGIQLAGLTVKGRSVVLKPNLVEFSPDRPINTDPRVVAAAIEAFRGLDASFVTVAEGAGHRRDTELMVEATGLGELLRTSKTPFVDLNLDDLGAVKAASSFTRLPEFYFGKTLLGADLVVSMPKLKTHHWTGATLSMKNLFGCIPGAVYGWPKNVLHWSGIHESIVDIAATLKPSFAIVDGITGMEGDGPINGTARACGALVFGSDLVAVDATCCRLMGLDPSLIPHLAAADRFLGRIAADKIDQRGESLAALQTPFKLLERFQYLRAAAG